MGWLEYRRNNFTKSQEFLEDAILSFNKYKEDYFYDHLASFYESEGNIYLLAGASYCKTKPISKEKINYYLDKAELAYGQLDHSDIKLAQVLANRARFHESIEEWKTAISLFEELFDRGKKMRKNDLMLDAVIHLFRICQRTRDTNAQIAYAGLAMQLDFFYLWSLLVGYLQR